MLWTVNCAWVQLIGDGLFNVIINTSLFSLLFDLLPHANNYPSSVKYISLLGWAAVHRQLVPSEASKVAGVADCIENMRVSPSPRPLWAGRDKDSN